MITVSSAFHWLNRSRFLGEARRALRDNGWLIIYDNFFSGRMIENPKYEDWNKNSYLRRYPTPPRNRAPLNEGDLIRAGFRLLEKETYSSEVLFSLDELVNYLVTQTNVIAAVERGDERVEDVRAWLRGELAPIFIGRRRTFPFGGTIFYLLKRGGGCS